MIVRCVDNKDCYGLILGKEYKVLSASNKRYCVEGMRGNVSCAKRRFIINKQ